MVIDTVTEKKLWYSGIFWIAILRKKYFWVGRVGPIWKSRFRLKLILFLLFLKLGMI
jgi:hypothetical protein